MYSQHLQPQHSRGATNKTDKTHIDTIVGSKNRISADHTEEQQEQRKSSWNLGHSVANAGCCVTDARRSAQGRSSKVHTYRMSHKNSVNCCCKLQKEPEKKYELSLKNDAQQKRALEYKGKAQQRKISRIR